MKIYFPKKNFDNNIEDHNENAKSDSNDDVILINGRNMYEDGTNKRRDDFIERQKPQGSEVACLNLLSCISRNYVAHI